MFYYFFFDKENSISNTNCLNKYIQYTGKDGYNLQRQKEKEGHHFIVVNNPESNDKYVMEVTAEGKKFYESYRKSEKRRQISEENCPYQFISLESLLETESNDRMNISNDNGYFKLTQEILTQNDQIKLNLHYALQQLSEGELDLINQVFLSDHPISMTEYGSKIGITPTAVSKKCKRIFKRIVKFL